MEYENNKPENENEVNEPAPKYEYVSTEEYFEIIKTEGRFEYYDGQVIELDAVSWQHDLIEHNLSLKLGIFLDGKGCRVMGPNIAVGTASGKSFMFPDRLICCGEMIFKPELDILLNPAIIFEVLSPSTKGIDENRKLHYYNEIRTLKEYVMIDSQKCQVKVARRISDNDWPFEEINDRNGTLFIETIRYQLPLPEIYKDTGL